MRNRFQESSARAISSRRSRLGSAAWWVSLVSSLVSIACGSERTYDPNDGGANGGAHVGGGGGAGGPNENPSELMIATTSLPEGRYNLSYDTRLAVGPEGASVSWELVEGSLPEGLELSREGRLRGRPLAMGEFVFRVRAESNDYLPDEQELTLQVTRKRWLAYVSDEDELGVDRLYVVDVSNELFRKTMVSTGLSASEDVHGYFAARDNYSAKLGPYQTSLSPFSADGRYIAYRAGTSTDTDEIYVVDVSGEDPSEPVQLTTNDPVVSFAWSPHGHELVTMTGNGFVDVFREDEGTWGGELIGEAPSSGWVEWPLDDLLYVASSSDYEARRTDGGFGALAEVERIGSTFQVNHEHQRVAYQSWDNCGGTAELVDYAEGTVSDRFNGYTQFNPSLSRAAAYASVMTIFPGVDPADDPSFTFASYGCHMTWSPNGRYVDAEDGSPGFGYYVLDTESEEALRIPGEFENNYGYSNRDFSADSRWYHFGMTGSYVTELGDAGPSEGRTLRPPGQGNSRFRDFSPNSAAIFEVFAPTDEAARVDWSRLSENDEWSPLTEIALDALTSTEAKRAAWSADGAALAAVYGPRTGQTAQGNIYVVLTNSANPKFQKVSDYVSCDGTTCGRIVWYDFQP